MAAAVVSSPAVSVRVIGPERGGIGGYACRCTCGLVWSTSLSLQWAQREAFEHLAWHDRVLASGGAR